MKFFHITFELDVLPEHKDAMVERLVAAGFSIGPGWSGTRIEAATFSARSAMALLKALDADIDAQFFELVKPPVLPPPPPEEERA